MKNLIDYLNDGQNVHGVIKPSNDLSDSSLKIIERALLVELGSLYEVLRDSYLQMLFVRTKVDDKRFEDIQLYETMEDYILQLASLKRTLSSDYK